jgi:hypothetical protein
MVPDPLIQTAIRDPATRLLFCRIRNYCRFLFRATIKSSQATASPTHPNMSQCIFQRMLHGRVTLAACVAGRSAVNGQPVQAVQTFATVSPVSIAARNHKVIVVGGGSAGLSISHQLLRSGKFTQDDIAIIDPSTWHHYQPGWTLVGGGLKTKEELRRPLRDLIASKLKLYNDSVCTFSPEDNLITLGNGDKVSYEQLVVVPVSGARIT